jgi:hypothetical protein
MRREIRTTVLFIAGLAILGSAALHGMVNVPHLRGDLVEIGVRQTLVGAIMLVLYFSVVAMFAFGGLILGSATGSLRGKPVHQAPLWIVAATYMVFGLAAFLLVSRSPHMLGYSFIGALVAMGAALKPKRGEHGMRTEPPGI